MGQKLQREYLKRGSQLTSSEDSAVRASTGYGGQRNGLYKIYVIEDVETGKTELRANIVAEEELKK